MARKSEGFAGQKSIVLPESIIETLEKNPLTSSLYITHIGYYPKAQFHYRERKKGSSENILIFCIDGEGWVEIQGRKQNISGQNFFVIPANTEHRYGSNPKKVWSIYWLHFKGEKADQIAKLFDNEQIIPVTKENQRWQLFEEMYQTLEKGYSPENLGYANMTLWHFLSSFLFPNQFKQELSQKKQDISEKIIVYMKANIDQNLTLNQIASEFGYSVSHLSALFTKKTGYSLLDYFIQLKMQCACQYLDLTELKIKEISSLIGYADPYYFSRIFHKTIGVSPIKYRANPKG